MKKKTASIAIDLADLLIAIQCMELVEKNCKNAGIVTEVIAKFKKVAK